MKKKLFNTFFILLILSGLLLIINDKKIYLIDSYNSNIDNLINSGNRSYYMILEIPSISLKKEIFDVNSKSNDVNKNIQVLNSDTPTKDKGNIVLAGHSGNSNVSFFTDLDKLKTNDEIFIYYDNIKYTYIFKYKYDTFKNGVLNIYRNRDKNTLTLVTCDEKDKTKQIAFIAELKKAD